MWLIATFAKVLYNIHIMIDIKTIEHLAKLSRLKFSNQELQAYSQDLEEILNYADTLKNINTTGIEAATHALPLQNIFREDQANSYPQIEKLLKNAPEIEDHAFKVPRILT